MEIQRFFDNASHFVNPDHHEFIIENNPKD